MITDEVIAEGLRLDAERTPGEWIVGKCAPSLHKRYCDQLCRNVYASGEFDICNPCSQIRETDANFIAHAANHYADALREIQRLRKLCEPIQDERNDEESTDV